MWWPADRKHSSVNTHAGAEDSGNFGGLQPKQHMELHNLSSSSAFPSLSLYSASLPTPLSNYLYHYIGVTGSLPPCFFPQGVCLPGAYPGCGVHLGAGGEQLGALHFLCPHATLDLEHGVPGQPGRRGLSPDRQPAPSHELLLPPRDLAFRGHHLQGQPLPAVHQPHGQRGLPHSHRAQRLPEGGAAPPLAEPGLGVGSRPGGRGSLGVHPTPQLAPAPDHLYQPVLPQLPAGHTPLALASLAPSTVHARILPAAGTHPPSPL